LAQAQGGELLVAEGSGEPRGGAPEGREGSGRGARFELRLPLAATNGTRRPSPDGPAL
jgi:hypothetical protein